MAILLKVASVLVHGNVYESSINGEHFVVGLNSLFKFQKFVPERMGQKVQADTACAALKEPVRTVVSIKRVSKRSLGQERVEEGKHGICVCVRYM